MKEKIPQRVKNYFHYVNAQLASIRYGNPASKLAIIGVTGTDGKTTTCTLIYEILKEAGMEVGLVTSISARIGDKSIPTGFHVTTPSPHQLQSLLKDMVDAGIKYVVLETTSHALDQYRTAGIKYHTGVFTNVSYEHLDYHKTYESYLDTKAKLIGMISPGGFAVINRDDRSFEKLNLKAKANKVKTFTYGMSDSADLYASGLEETTTTTHFNVHFHKTHTADVKMHLPGEYNVYNALGAIQVALELGVDIKDIVSGLEKVDTLEGRWEVIQESPVKIVVDFAHTPNALEKMLKYAKHDNINGRVIVVFGAAGKRDIEKRPAMGRIAGELADITILTAEDPRGENITNINRQIAVGLKELNREEDKDYFSVPDRRKAIFKALNMAKDGDTVVITGKGHEKSLNLDGKEEIPWSDQMIVKEYIEQS